MSTLQATQGRVWRPSAVTHAFPLAAFQGLFLFRQHRNRPAKGLSHTLIPSESVCTGRPPVRVKTKVSGNLAKAAPRHARLQGLPVCVVCPGLPTPSSGDSARGDGRPSGSVCGGSLRGPWRSCHLLALSAPWAVLDVQCHPPKPGDGRSQATQGPRCLPQAAPWDQSRHHGHQGAQASSQGSPRGDSTPGSQQAETTLLSCAGGNPRPRAWGRGPLRSRLLISTGTALRL